MQHVKTSETYRTPNHGWKKQEPEGGQEDGGGGREGGKDQSVRKEGGHKQGRRNMSRVERTGGKKYIRYSTGKAGVCCPLRLGGIYVVS